MKILLRCAGICGEWILILIILFAFLIRTSSFQTYVAEKVTAFLSDEWETKVRIGKVDISLFNRIYLEDVYIADQKDKTLLSIKSLEVLISSFGSKHLSISEVILKQGKVWVYAQKPDGKMNFDFIADYFSSADTSASRSKFLVQLKSISLENTAFRYDDFRIPKSTSGLDFGHVRLANVSVQLSDFENNGPNTAFKIKHLSTKDQSGLMVKSLSADFNLNSFGLSLKNLALSLNRSNIYAKEIRYSYKSQNDLEDFNNKVPFNIEILSSSVNLADLAFFVPDLKGMDETIRIKGTVYNVINHFKIKDLALNIRKNTEIRGNFDLPDFSNLAAYDVKEILSSAKLDFKEINQIRIPGGKRLNLGENLESLGIVRMNNLVLRTRKGILTLLPVKIQSKQGDVAFVSPMSFHVVNEPFAIHNLRPDSVALRFDSLNIGKIIATPDLGVIDGDIKFSQFKMLDKGYALNGGQASINSLNLLGYQYQKIAIKELSIQNYTLKTSISINDPNAQFEIHGNADIDGKPNCHLNLDISKLNLSELGLVNQANTSLKGTIELNAEGKNLDNLNANISMETVEYKERNQKVGIEFGELNLIHTEAADELELRSSIADLDFKGKINPATIADDILYGISRVVPNLVQVNKPIKSKINNEIDAKLTVRDAQEIADLFAPGLSISPKATLVLKFNANEDLLGVNLLANALHYDSIFAKDINFTQRVDEKGVTANLLSSSVDFGDSIILYDLDFLTTGNNGALSSSLGWDKGRNSESRIAWKTNMFSSNDFKVSFDKSRFTINGYKWFIKEGSDIAYQDEKLTVNKLDIYSDRKNQKIEASGVLSKFNSDHLAINITSFDLEDLSHMLKLDAELSGKLNGNLSLTNPFESLGLTSKLDLSDFKIDNEEVGTIAMNADYDSKLEKVDLNGNLIYRDVPTLTFSGNYFIDKQDDNLALQLDFKNTDISFTNAFMDPDLVADIEGKLNGVIQVKGSPSSPKLSGALFLKEAAANFTLLGCRYTMNGKLTVEEDGFLINKMPIRDSEGNVANLDLTVYHRNFAKMSYNVDIDFEEDYHHTVKNNPSGKIDKFMLLNTKYKEGDIYYGKAYGRGTANISGYGAIMDITVNVKTRKGTKLVFPMYGTSELEDESIIHFVSDENSIGNVAQKINFTGVNMDLGFDINSDADIRLVFNEQTQDEIKAKTEGKINLKLDAYNQMFLDGGLKILPGSVYNFTMGPARKPFDITDGSINWSGDVYNADMKIVTSYLVSNTNMLELSPEQTDKTLAKQDALCILNLTGTLVKPNIAFELSTPKAPEGGKALINRINEDKDELNRQFFSLMLFSKFQPLKGTNSANESAALDLVESQINTALSQMSKNYQVKMDLGSDNVSTSVQKSFIGDRLIVTGSVGGNTATGGLTGDVSVEYLVNESGTFRVNAFNRSNSNTVKENAAPFTQGAGLSYHEDFNGRKDFVLWQSFLDVFRPKDEKVVKLKRNKRQTKVPPIGTNNESSPEIEKKEENE